MEKVDEKGRGKNKGDSGDILKVVVCTFKIVWKGCDELNCGGDVVSVES